MSSPRSSTPDNPHGHGTWRTRDGAAVAFSDARRIWTREARAVLVDTARRYHAYVTYGELAEAVQARTGIRTRSQMRNWIGWVLGRVADDCERRNEPPLSALCVRQDETVGEGYAYVVEIQGKPIPDDLDQHAAEARLECYRFFGADLPPDGGRAALTPKVAAARHRAKGRHSESVDVCPHCHTALPKSGICDYCS